MRPCRDAVVYRRRRRRLRSAVSGGGGDLRNPNVEEEKTRENWEQEARWQAVKEGAQSIDRDGDEYYRPRNS
jgi:hypothetical protein